MALRAAAEACDLAAGVAKRREVAAREIRRSELVVEKPHRAAASPCRDQRVAQPPPDAVVAHDVELDEHVSLCLRDRREDRLEGRFAIDEKPRRVAAGRRQRRQPADRRAEARRLAIDERLAARLSRWRSTDREGLDRVVGLRPQRSQRLLPAAQRLHVAVEAAVAEDEIERDRRDGQEHQRDDPGDRPLRRAVSHDCVDRQRDPRDLDRGEGQRDREGPIEPDGELHAKTLRGRTDGRGDGIGTLEWQTRLRWRAWPDASLIASFASPRQGACETLGRKFPRPSTASPASPSANRAPASGTTRDTDRSPRSRQAADLPYGPRRPGPGRPDESNARSGLGVLVRRRDASPGESARLLADRKRQGSKW